MAIISSLYHYKPLWLYDIDQGERSHRSLRVYPSPLTIVSSHRLLSLLGRSPVRRLPLQAYPPSSPEGEHDS